MPNSDVMDKLIRISVPVLAPLSPSMDTGTDQLSSFYRPVAVPFVRHSPLPVQAQSAPGAASKSIAQTAVNRTVYGVNSNINQLTPPQVSSGITPTKLGGGNYPIKGTGDPQSLSIDTEVADGNSFLRTPQFLGGINLAENGNFEASSKIDPPGWTGTDQGAGFPGAILTYETTAPQAGTRSLIMTASVQFGGAYATRKYQAKPGDAFRISGYIFQSALAQAGTIVLSFLDASGAQIGVVDTGAGNGGSAAWTFVSATGVAPANTVSARLKIQTEQVGGGTVKFDNIFCCRMIASFEVTPINTAGTPTATSALCSQSGTSTTILVAGSTWQFGDGTISYNSGSVNPGAFGTFYVYADDPGLTGGAVTYVSTATPSNCNAADGRLFFGKITTAGGGGGASTGGGSGGGGPQSKSALL